MKNTIKLLLVTVLFCATVFADGSMGNGGRTCPPNTVCLVNTPTVEKTNEAETDGTIMKFIQDYLGSIFG